MRRSTTAVVAFIVAVLALIFVFQLSPEKPSILSITRELDWRQVSDRSDFWRFAWRVKADNFIPLPDEKWEQPLFISQITTWPAMNKISISTYDRDGRLYDLWLFADQIYCREFWQKTNIGAMIAIKRDAGFPLDSTQIRLLDQVNIADSLIAVDTTFTEPVS
ncbi:MAG: hypothetical protein WCT08_01530 [Patescibacteria group bacterium]|jgi:hypothetical protein